MVAKGSLEAPVPLVQLSTTTALFKLVEKAGRKATKPSSKAVAATSDHLLRAPVPVTASPVTLVELRGRSHAKTRLDDTDGSTSSLHHDERRAWARRQMVNEHGDWLLLTIQEQGLQLHKASHFKTVQSWSTPQGTQFAAGSKYVVRYFDRAGSQSSSRKGLISNAHDGKQGDWELHRWVYAVIKRSPRLKKNRENQTVWIWADDTPLSETPPATPSASVSDSGDHDRPVKTSRPLASVATVTVPSPDVPAFDNCLIRTMAHPIFMLDTTSSLQGQMVVVYQNGQVELQSELLDTALATHQVPEAPASRTTIWATVLDTDAESYQLSRLSLPNAAHTVVLMLTQTHQQRAQGDATFEYLAVTTAPYSVQLIGTCPISLGVDAPSAAGVASESITATPAPLGVAFCASSGRLSVLSALGVWYLYYVVFSPSGGVVVSPVSQFPMNHLGPWMRDHYGALKPSAKPALWSQATLAESQQLIALPGGYVAVLGELPPTATTHGPEIAVDETKPLGDAPEAVLPPGTTDAKVSVVRQYSLSLWDTTYNVIHAEQTVTMPQPPTTDALFQSAQAPVIHAQVLPNQQIALVVSFPSAHVTSRQSKSSPSSAQQQQLQKVGMMVPNPLQSNEVLDGGRVAWASQVLLCPFYAPKPTLLMSLCQKQASARYYCPGDPHHLLETPVATTTGTTEAPKNATIDATDGQDLLRSGHEAIQADHRLPAVTAPVPGINKLSQELANSEARDARLLRAVFDVEATKDAPSFTHTVLQHVAPAGWAKLVEQGIALVNPTPDQLLAQAMAFEKQPEQAPCIAYVEKSGPIWLREISYALKLPALTSTIHLALQNATWAQRREVALDLKEPWGGPLALGEDPWHVSPFRVSPYYLQVPISTFAIAAIASRCFGQALQPNFEAPMARCAQGHAFNPLPLNAIPAAAENQAEVLFKYESNPMRTRQRTSLGQLARQSALPDTVINTVAIASDRCDVDFWPRHVVDFLLRTSNLSSSMVNNRLVPYLLMRREWGMVHLAMFHAKDIPEAHIILALQHRIRHVAAQLHAAANLKTSYTKVDTDQLPAPEFDFVAYVTTEGVVGQIVLKVLNDTAALAYITAALGYRMDPVTTVRAMRAILQPEDTLVLVRLLESLWSARDATEKLTATWYQADQAIGKVLPALTNVSAFLTQLLDAHMAVFINHPDLSAVVTGLQLRLKRVRQSAKRLQDQLIPWLLVFPQADKAWWAEYPGYRGIKASTINVTKRPFTFALSMRQLYLAAAEESKQAKARSSDSSYLGQSYSITPTLPVIPLALRCMMTLDSTALNTSSVTLNPVSADNKRGQVGMWTRSFEYTDRCTRRQAAQHLLGTMENDVLRQSFKQTVARLKCHDEGMRSQSTPGPTHSKSVKPRSLKNQTFRVDLIQW